MLELFDRLAEPFPADAVSWRVGSTTQDKSKGMALAFIDARDVMERLDFVCGPAGWERRHPHVGGTTTCEIAIWVEGRGWVVKTDGAGDTDVEAEKGSLSDSFKRAAVNWGIGRYLYSLPAPWVELVPAGRSFKIKDSEHAKLRRLLNDFTGVRPKASAQAKRDQDFEFFKEKIEAATDMEALGAIGREIKQALPMMPAAMRDPLHDAYAIKREELMEQSRFTSEEGELDAGFRGAIGPSSVRADSAAPLSGRGSEVA